MIIRTLFVLLQIVVIAGISLSALENIPAAHAEENANRYTEDGFLRPRLRPQHIEEYYCMAEALYWEGRNQSHEGMTAIGNVVMNRVASADFPDTICGVVHQGPLDGGVIKRHKCQFSYYCDGKSDKPANDGNILEIRAWQRAQDLAREFLYGDVTDLTAGSTYYHANYVNPNWANVFPQVAVVGKHLFYRP